MQWHHDLCSYQVFCIWTFWHFDKKNVLNKHAAITAKKVKGKKCQGLTCEVKKSVNQYDKTLWKAHRSKSSADQEV